jgi:hypothetical protein
MSVVIKICQKVGSRVPNTTAWDIVLIKGAIASEMELLKALPKDSTPLMKGIVEVQKHSDRHWVIRSNQ